MVHEFARELWKTLPKTDEMVVSDANGGKIRGFSGLQLTKHISNYLSDKVKKQDVESRCQDLVTFEYLRLAAARRKVTPMRHKFESTDKCLYQFVNAKYRQFAKEEEPDRQAWTEGTKILIHSTTFKGWSDGTIINVTKRNNNNSRYNKIKGLSDIENSSNVAIIGINMKDEFDHPDLTVAYGPSSQPMQKVLSRYDSDVKSKAQFIETRKSWKIGSNVEIYVKNDSLWYPGVISKLFEKSVNDETATQLYDVFEIGSFYNKRPHTVHLYRWSDELREYCVSNWQNNNNDDDNDQGIDMPPKYRYPKGSKVIIWSASKKCWFEGTIIEVIEKYNAVNVRYPGHEKLVKILSNVIQPFTPNFENLPPPLPDTNH